MPPGSLDNVLIGIQTNLGNFLFHFSQQAMAETLLQKFQLNHCKPAYTPCQSGLKINLIENDGAKPPKKERLVKDFQSFIGGLNWLSINTRPDIATAYNLLSHFNHNPSQGHLDAEKYVLPYLKHTSLHGICYRQGEIVCTVVLLFLTN